MRDKKVAVLGAGSWGTALAMSLARSGHEVSLWGRNPEVMAEMEMERCLADLAAHLEQNLDLQV